MPHSPGFLKIVEQSRRLIREIGVEAVKARFERGERFHLQRMGYTNVRSMAGGWKAWLEAGGLTEK